MLIPGYYLRAAFVEKLTTLAWSLSSFWVSVIGSSMTLSLNEKDLKP